jgi:O-antigen/teichoic acid export membrane protein
MPEVMTPVAAAVSPEAAAEVRSQIRGSGLLVVGRVLAAGLTLMTQVLIVRHLSTNDFGAWAYAFSVVVFWQTLSNLGFQDALSRFVPIYHQQREYAKMFGTIFLAAAFVLLFSGAVIAAFFVAPEKVLALVRGSSDSLAVLFILIFLIPLEALDVLLMGLFASLMNARAVFFRRYVLAPGLRLGVVVLLIVFDSDVKFLAYGYLAASLAGILIFTGLLVAQLRRDGLLSQLRRRGIDLPTREVLSFSLPMMTTDMLVSLMQTLVVVLLGYYHGMRDVAFFRVVLPIAAVNEIMSLTAAVLYMPAAARLFARGDREGLRHLYWQTATWMAVLSFPLFVLTFGFANPLTRALYGARYADAGLLLAILSLAYYFKLVFGFNGLTVKAMNRVGSVVVYNLLTALANAALCLLLIPAYGALGAALAVSGSILLYTIFKQAAFTRATGVSSFDRRYAPFYAMLILATLSQFAVFGLASANIYLAGLAALISVGIVLLFGKKELKLAEVFPESARIPLLRRFAI